MTRYVVRRLLRTVVALFVVSLLTFVVFYLLPSADPARLRAGPPPTPELLASIRDQLGLDDSWTVQLGHYLRIGTPATAGSPTSRCRRSTCRSTRRSSTRCAACSATSR